MVHNISMPKNWDIETTSGSCGLIGSITKKFRLMPKETSKYGLIFAKELEQNYQHLMYLLA